MLAACASVPPPIEQMAVSRVAVSNANSAGASEFAPVMLKSAMDKMAAAEHAMTEKDYVKQLNWRNRLRSTPSWLQHPAGLPKHKKPRKPSRKTVAYCAKKLIVSPSNPQRSPS